MVLVDSSHPEQQKRLPPALNDLDATWLREQEFLEFTMPFGIPRLLGFCGSEAEVRAAECNFHSVRESVAELKAFPKAPPKPPPPARSAICLWRCSRTIPTSPNPSCPKTW